MPSLAPALQWLSLSDFIAGDLVFFEAMAASAVVAAVLAREPRRTVHQYRVALTVTTAVSLLCALLATSLIFITPVGVQHLTEATPNSFPSHHALLAALIVSAVFLVQPRKALPFALASTAVDTILVVGHHHHLLDVAGSTCIVALGTLAAVSSTSTLCGWMARAPWKTQGTDGIPRPDNAVPRTMGDRDF